MLAEADATLARDAETVSPSRTRPLCLDMRIRRWLRRLITVVHTFIATILRSAQDGSPSPASAPSAPYDLGELPDHLAIRWPTPPTIEREVAITSRDQIDDRWREPKTRLRVLTDLDWLVLDADDVEIVVAEGVQLRRVFICRGRKRIRFEGGTYEQIEMQMPVQFLPPPAAWRSDWLVEDVLLDGVSVASDADSALLLRGRRIAIVHSVVEAARYAIWVGDAGCVQSEDIVVADCRLESDGLAPTVGLSDVLRSVIVDSSLRNVREAHYVVLGHSEDNFAFSNELFGAGETETPTEVEA